MFDTYVYYVVLALTLILRISSSPFFQADLG